MNKPKLYFKTYWLHDDIFCDPPELSCKLYVKRHRWWPLWKKAGVYTEVENVSRQVCRERICLRLAFDLIDYTRDFEVYRKDPVYGWRRVRGPYDNDCSDT